MPRPPQQLAKRPPFFSFLGAAAAGVAVDVGCVVGAAGVDAVVGWAAVVVAAAAGAGSPASLGTVYPARQLWRFQFWSVLALFLPRGDLLRDRLRGGFGGRSRGRRRAEDGSGAESTGSTPAASARAISPRRISGPKQGGTGGRTYHLRCMLHLAASWLVSSHDSSSRPRSICSRPANPDPDEIG